MGASSSVAGWTYRNATMRAPSFLICSQWSMGTRDCENALDTGRLAPWMQISSLAALEKTHMQRKEERLGRTCPLFCAGRHDYP